MKLTFSFQSFFSDKKLAKKQVGHFLLEQAHIDVSVVFDDSSVKVIRLVRAASGSFELELGKDDIPVAAESDGTLSRRLIRRLNFELIVPFEAVGKTFELLHIVQQFTATPGPANSDFVVDYRFTPFAWVHTGTRKARTANLNTHPLLDLSKLNQNQILINALVLDLTELWDHLHQKNKVYAGYKDLTEPSKVTFKVFAHLGGNAFIYYCVVPSYVAESSKVSPHIFYSPSDYAEVQNLRNERPYLLGNQTQFEGKDDSSSASNGATLLLGYLLPPVDDVRIPTLNPKSRSKAEMIDAVNERRRNVVNFEFADATKKRIEPQYWNIGAGFERAFYALGEIRPQQILLMPQVHVTDRGVAKGNESQRHVNNVTSAIFHILQTHGGLLAAKDDELVVKDKLILSAYSESGWDLWESSANNLDEVKAIIGIEPNSVNPRGAAIIPKLLAKKVKVYIIGRHQGFNDHYRPKIAKPLQDQIRFLPDEPRKVLAYPPDPDLNDFVKYRVARMQDQNLDPRLLPKEKEVLQDLAKRKRPITGKAAIAAIMTENHNSDKLSDGELTSIFYTHNFALTGGQEMQLDDAVRFYDKPVKYRTFFQQAVEEIG
ncbi:MAG TPA: hypothetical protein VEQ59_18525 [Polyangiaceae bacterium]|nr:hypothetical protein [Polyangiaceae bacterium]